MKLIRKRFWSLLMSMVIVLVMLPTASFAATNTAYLDSNGVIQTVTATVVDGSFMTLTDGWYVVNSTVSTGTLTVNGDVKLILADGALLMVTGSTKAGIEVIGNNSLTIYGQTKGSGTLDTTGGKDSAGIGASLDAYNAIPTGTINIYGGTIVAKSTGTFGGAGIGCEKDGFGSKVNIYGGTVTATGGGSGGAGIGGGYMGDGGITNIYGGTVTAIGRSDGAGIGGGYLGIGGSTNIYGGTVTAIGGSYSYGIGPGYNGSDGSCVIAGGSVMTSNMRNTPTNGSSNGSATVYPATIVLDSISTATKITSLATSPGSYGINDLYTDSFGKLYLWLPKDSVVTAVTTEAGECYVGSVTTVSGTPSGTYTLNQAPTDISLSASTVEENNAVGSVCSDFLTTDANTGDTFTYSLVSGDGDTDNSAFIVADQALKLNVTPDYESKNSYSFRIRSTDAGGLYYEKAFVITITNVNEAPTITSPATFNANIGNQVAVTGISFADPDAESSSVTATFNITSGTLTATSQGGVAAIGSGTTNLSLSGSMADLNSFLAAGNLTYTSAPYVPAPVTLSVTINDNGNSGSGGAKTASSEISILIPVGVTSVLVPADGNYKIGDVLDFTFNFNKAVIVDTSGGTPYLPITLGSSTVRATYLSGNGTASLVFQYTIISGDSDSDGVSLDTSIHLNGGTIQSEAMNALLTLNSIPNTAGILVDTAPTTVVSVTPANGAANVPVSGTITVIFDEPMSPHTGTVTLTTSSGSSITLDAAGGSWTGSRIYTISYHSLSYSTDYSISIFGFQDMAGNEMTSDTGRSFTTEEEPLTPSVSPKSLTVFKNGRQDISVAFGQGVMSATGASITVEKSSIASVSAAQVVTPCAITVTGLAVGTTDITIAFHDTSSTTERITVTVLPVAPVWPAGSTLNASNVTRTGVTLTWTEAQDSTAITGYKLYQDGALIATLSGTTTNYEVSGLSASTTYSFQVQAGNADDVWTTDGPIVRVTTNAPSSGGSSHSTGPTSPVPIVTQPAKKINYPLSVSFHVETAIDQKGHATVTLSKTSIKEAIKRAQAQGKAQGKTENGITIAVNIDLVDKASSLDVVLSQQVLKNLIDAGVKGFEINGKFVSMSFDLASLKEIQKQSTGDVTIRLTPVNKLSKKAKTVIGDRPVYNMTISYVKKNKTEIITNFNSGRATLAFPYTPGKNENPGYLFAVYVDSRGEAQRISNSAYDANKGRIIFNTDHISVFGIGYKVPSTKFIDISKHWAKESIDYMVGGGLLSGTTGAIFSPDTAITRRTLVIALGRLAGVDVTGYKSSSFSDVNTGDPCQPYMEWAYNKGILLGTDNYINPDGAITREEMAVIMINYVNATGFTLPVTREKVIYTDESNISSNCKEAVAALQQAGIMMGENMNQFNPRINITRGEFCALMYRYIKLTLDPATAQGWAMNDSGQWMYYQDGKALTSWLSIGQDNNIRYYFTKDAVMVAGEWIQIDDKWYYFHTDGSLAVSTKIDGFEVDENGVRKTIAID